MWMHHEPELPYKSTSMMRCPIVQPDHAGKKIPVALTFLHELKQGHVR